MRIGQLRQADLNLLVVFSVLAEERNVSRSAVRLMLSQPAVSRALQRLRQMFQDDLLVRVAGGYEPTPRGARLLQELSVILPRLDRLLSGTEFSPADERATFRVAGTDNATHVLCPPLVQQLLPWARTVSLQMLPWHDGTFEDLERGRLDLTLNADDGHTPERLHREVIYEEEFVCAVSTDSPHTRRISMKDYVKGLHVGVGILAGRQTIPEQRLAAAGYQRTCAIEVPYFSAALRCVAGTPLIATVPKRLALAESRNPAIRLVEAPAEMTGFRYMMVWHPRVNTDAAHVWFRSMVRAASLTLPPPGQLATAERSSTTREPKAREPRKTLRRSR